MKLSFCGNNIHFGKYQGGWASIVSIILEKLPKSESRIFDTYRGSIFFYTGTFFTVLRKTIYSVITRKQAT